MTAYNPAKFGRCARKIVVDVDPAELAKFAGMDGFAMRVEADAKAFIDALLPLARAAVPRDRAGVARPLRRLEAPLSRQ